MASGQRHRGYREKETPQSLIPISLLIEFELLEGGEAWAVVMVSLFCEVEIVQWEEPEGDLSDN